MAQKFIKFNFNFNLIRSIKLNKLLIKTLILLTFCHFLPCVICSIGDRNKHYNSCLINCTRSDCTENGKDFDYSAKNSSYYYKYLGWNCEGECKYYCMWNTIHLLNKNGFPIPQFYGKWPFTRILGFQEPASVLFSLLNLLAHLGGLIQLRKKVPKNAPLFWFWHIFAAVCINGWIWSIVFHTRDTPFTEKMDYFSAFSMVTFSLFAVFVRYFETVNSLLVLTIGAGIFSFFVNHIYFLAFVNFDYGYNMKTSVTIGVLNAAFWLIWSTFSKKTHPHVWKCVLFVILAISSIALELFDFPPLYWLLDAHALWHFVTAPITPLWYSFIIDDCIFLSKKKAKKHD